MPEITIQPAASAGFDTYLDEANPTTIRGVDALVHLGIDSSGNNQDVLFKFDLSSITKGSKIQSAILTLTSFSGSPDTRVEIARILSGNSDWAEATATWNKREGSQNWAGSTGCETEGTDIAVSKLFLDPSYSWTIPGENDFVLSNNDFQALIDVANHGFKLYHTPRSPTITRSAISRSSDYGTASERPKLFVRWIEPSGRLFEYTFNKYDPQKRLFNSQGDIVEPNEIRPNNWIFTQGSQLPSGKVYSSLVPDPRMGYIVGVKNDEEGEVVSIETDRNQFADQILQRLTRGV